VATINLDIDETTKRKLKAIAKSKGFSSITLMNYTKELSKKK
jgi:hypothetical protein